MKVLITSRSFGKIGDSAKKVLTDAGIQIDNISVGFDQAHFEKIIPEYDALIIGAHDFSEADMERCPNLKIICKHGVGLDNIHVNKAKELGMPLEYNLYGIDKQGRGRQKGLGYPCEIFWEAAAEHGSTAIIGVDAHRPIHFERQRYLNAREYLNALGLNLIEEI